MPIIASNPHFLAADRSVQDAVNGLIPDEILHRSYMDIEPTTGSKSLKIGVTENKCIYFLNISCYEWFSSNAIQYKCC